MLRHTSYSILPYPSTSVMLFQFALICFSLSQVSIENNLSTSQDRGKDCIHSTLPIHHLWDFTGYVVVVCATRKGEWKIRMDEETHEKFMRAKYLSKISSWFKSGTPEIQVRSPRPSASFSPFETPLGTACEDNLDAELLSSYFLCPKSQFGLLSCISL